MPAFILAITLDDVVDGFGRFFGWVSDNIGRENTMFIAFGVAAVSLFLLTQFGHSPWLISTLAIAAIPLSAGAVAAAGRRDTSQSGRQTAVSAPRSLLLSYETAPSNPIGTRTRRPRFYACWTDFGGNPNDQRFAATYRGGIIPKHGRNSAGFGSSGAV
jgi:MFS family permease